MKIEILKQFDHEKAFFYCDPPYTSGVGYDVISTTEFEHERLRDTLKNIKGRFLLSYDDSPKIRELYKDFEIVSVERLCGLKNKFHDENKKVYKELLIANYPIKELYNNVR